MNVFDALRRESLEAGVSLPDKEAALAAVARAAKRCAALDDLIETALIEALRKREDLGSTGFGKGIAIPHCRLDTVNEFVVGLIAVPDGVDFDAMDDKPVRLIVFIVAPSTRSDEHVRLLSGISQVLMIPGAVDEMVASAGAEALEESFLRHARDRVDASKGRESDLLHVFVQDEDCFRDILQVLESPEGVGVVVLDAENTSAYLAKMPMFAGFWTDNPSSFSRMVVALLSREMTNETIRRIERITGPLQERSGVVVAVQSLFYCEGRLNP